MTDIGRRLLSHFSPKINKSGEIFSAMVANEKGTGAIEKMFAYGDKVTETYAKADNVYNLDSDLLDQAMTYLSYFSRYYAETDGSFTKRIKAAFIRKHDETFGTVWNMKHVFEYFFPDAIVYCIDNIGKYTDNLLKNSDFESKEPELIEKWQLTNCEISTLSAFSGEKSILFTEDNGELSQEVEIGEGYYFVTFALKGSCNVEIIGEDGENKALLKIGEKLNSEGSTSLALKSTDWNFVQCFFKAESEETIEIKIIGKQNSNVDLVTLDKKTDYSRFIVYPWFNGQKAGKKTLHLSENGEDPIEGINYDSESYFDNTYLIGPSNKSFSEETYRDLIEMTKAAGTKGDIMLLTNETA